jgi:hypothetical protein
MMNGSPHKVERKRQAISAARLAASSVALALAVLSCAPVLAADWHQHVHPDDLTSIEQAETTARSTLQAIGPEDYGHDEVTAVAALLDARAMARPVDRLPGDWRCRSIQLGEYGLFSYPYFRCHIEQVDGGLRFRKSSGSQRRTGWLHADIEGRWAFVGSSHYNDDPVPDYSGLHEDSDAEDRERDSVGILETLADGRLRMILDAKPGQVEIYELIR